MELHYDVKYINHDYRMIHSMADMISKNQMTDCSLVAEGKTLRAHRVILGASSEYLLNAFCTLPEGQDTETTVIIFDNIRYDDVFNVVKFIYTGKVTLNEKDTLSFINLGNLLKVRGIIGIGIDVNKEQTTAASQELSPPKSEAGTSKGTKRSRDIDAIEEEMMMTQPGKRTRRKKVFRECVTTLHDSDDNESMNCSFCSKGFHNKSTLNNHERFCGDNPNRKLSTCPICGMVVKPGSMTFHKKNVHGYVPKSRKRQPLSVKSASVMNIGDQEPSKLRRSRRLSVKNWPNNAASNYDQENIDTTATADEFIE